MTHPLEVHLAHHRYLRERLEAEFPDADEETLRDTVAGMTNLPEMLAAVVRSHLDDKALATALRARAAHMHERLSRIETRAGKKRDLVLSAMENSDLQNLTEPDFTISLRRAPPPLVVVDEDAIPKDYWVPQPAKLDRQVLIADLRRGRDVPGANLGNGSTTLSVRTK